MAVYKVAQDVEAEDKLLGPFSFRQFIYLMVASISIAAAWGLFQMFPPLVIIPLPIIVFFGVLALPLRKDQPMETYLAAIVSFYIKPRKRLWTPDGIESNIIITAPKNEEVQLTKGISTTEAEKRLAYLAALADSRGWSIRHTVQPAQGATAMVEDVYNAAKSTQDMLDDNSGVVQAFDSMIDQADARRRETMVAKLHGLPQAPLPPNQTQVPIPVDPLTPAPSQPLVVPNDTTADPQISYNPYPSSMHQSVIAPLGDESTPVKPPQQTSLDTPETTSISTPSPAIMDLANNKDLSIEAIAHEADRRTKRELEDEGEVVISLR